MTDKIYHIADIHCRNYKRHSEYKAVFRKLFKYIKKTKTDNSVIYLAGDIVHQKTDMTPELVSIVSNLFKECADILPTIVITGNHDTNLNNDSRLDALSPIVDALDHPNLHYWKDNGLYKIDPSDNITYSVFSVFNDPADWIPAKKIKGDDIKIALHHGAVNGATTEINFQIKNDHVKSNIFRGYDYALLGDIHKYQYLDKKERVCYPGSLIQQNYGEDLVHGLVVWDLKNETKEYVPIPNDIAYATLHFKDNQLLTEKSYINALPKYLRLRIKYESTDKEVIEEYIKTLKKKHVFREYLMSRNNALGYNISNADMTIGDVRDVEYQNKLLEQYLKQVELPGDLMIDQIRHMNRVLNSEINSNKKVVRNVTWKPLKFEFSNMFSYGPNNIVDFRDLRGLQGLFAPNASGKSTLLDAVTFCLFDKCSRTWRAAEVLNIKKKAFKSKFTFEMGGDEYVVVRNGRANEVGHVRIDVDFYKTENGKKVEDLKSKDRDATNKNIRSYIGTYDDFLLTALSTQNDNRNFVFKTQKERKELLYSFLDISLFTQLWNAGKLKLKEKKAVIKASQETINQINETEYYETERELTSALTTLKAERKTVLGQIDELKKEISTKRSKIVKIPLMRDIQVIESDLKSTDNELRQIISDAKSLKIQLDLLETKKTNLTEKLPSIPATDANVIKQKITELDKEARNMTKVINDIKSKLVYAQNQAELLKTYDYDPDCEYCINNEIVKTALIEVDAIDSYNSDLQKHLTSNEKLSKQLSELKSLYEQLLAYQKIQNAINTNNLQIETTHSQIEVQRLRFNECHASLKEFNAEKSSIATYEKAINVNAQLEKNIGDVTAIVIDLEKNENKLQLSIKDKETSLVVTRNNIKSLLESKNKLKSLETDYDVYSIYVKAVSPKGIPYMLLTKVLPVLESEVNKLLSDIVQFAIELKTDDKQNILCHINYSNGNAWPIELASGMEKFITSLAIRSALVEVTSLPRPNFMAIDEGFGVLDSTNVSNIYLLFNKIKAKFDFILCITHLDTLKDLADATIEISKKSKEYSYVNNTL